MKTFKHTALVSSMALLAACGSDSSDKQVKADTVYQNGYVYTVDERKTVAQAVAVKEGEIIFVGSNSGVNAFIGSGTQVVDLENKMMMPGLHDVHIHPTGIVDVDMCGFGVEAKNLDEIVDALEECKETYQYADGEMILALQWNSYEGNGVTANYSNLREALDAVSTTQAVYLQGPDGHSGAANSYALNQVKNASGDVIGINKDTLADEWKEYAPFVGVDAQGNPNGYLTESAMHLAGVPNFLFPLQQNPDELPKIPEKLNKYGITSVQDAYTGPSELALYKTLADDGQMTFRLTTAQSYDVSDYVGGNKINYQGLVADLVETKNSLSQYPFIKADSVKIMLDGVQEGNPWETPPTLPTSVMLNSFKQPIMDLSQPSLSLTGYVDTNSTECLNVRANPADFDEISEKDAFNNTYGFYPVQCSLESGELLAADANSLLIKEQGVNTKTFLNNFVTALDGAGMTVHMHSVGDGATRAAIDAIEAAKVAHPDSTLPHAIAHMQVVHPDDQKRMGDLGIYLAYTYAWAIPSYEYDLSVMPFIEELSDLSPASIYDVNNYYMQATYPTRTTKDAGAVLIAGSDAPVDTREPVPFVHMATAMTRSDFVGEELIALNADQVLNVHEIIEAYTINGAKALRQDEQVGSIEVGKRADLIVIDRNIVALAESENPEDVIDVFDTQVLTTIFDGKVVYNVAQPE